MDESGWYLLIFPIIACSVATGTLIVGEVRARKSEKTRRLNRDVCCYAEYYINQYKRTHGFNSRNCLFHGGHILHRFARRNNGMADVSVCLRCGKEFEYYRHTDLTVCTRKKFKEDAEDWKI